MSKSSQPEISMLTSSKTHHKIWLNLNKESKFYKINWKFSKIKVPKNTKLSKITIILNSLRYIKEIRPKPNSINMNFKRNKRSNSLTKISTKFKNLTWSFYLSRKTCKILGFNMKKLAKTETILVSSLLIEMMSFVFFIRNPTYKKIFFVNLKSLSKIFKTIFVWLLSK